MIILSLKWYHAAAQDGHLHVSAGLSADLTHFRWSIAGNTQGESPNVLSELSFRGVTSAGPFLDMSYKPVKFADISIFYRRNGIFSGRGMDEDYEGDNRTSRVYGEPFSSRRGFLEAFQAGGHLHLVNGKRLFLGAGFFYSSVMQKFFILNSDFEGLQSTYTTRWKGTGISLDAGYEVSKKISFAGSLSCAFYRYHAEADWNLIYAFMHPLSFEQHADGLGTTFTARFSYRLRPFINLVTDAKIGTLKAGRGTDKSYLVNQAPVLTQFNGAISHSGNLSVGFCFSFL